MKKSYTNWKSEQDNEGILWLDLDVPDTTTNVLSQTVLEELGEILDELAEQTPKGLVIGSAKSSGFIAGADVSAFGSLTDEDQALQLIQQGQGVMDKIESLGCTSVAMINGFCLGGGLEMSLACDYRVALDEPRTRIGLPEVLLGIHPGFGGTVRSIRLLGPLAAMDLMLTGRTLDARRAQRIGLVDFAVPQRQLRRAAAMMIQERPRHKAPGRVARIANHRLVRPLVAWQMRRQVAKKAKREHYPAPYALIDLWVGHADRSMKMYREEARSVARLITGETAQNLVRVFQLQTRLKALGDKKVFTPKHIHVIGAGVMGGDIAAWCALQGFHVTVQDTRPQALADTLQRATNTFKRRYKRLHRLTTAAQDRLMADPQGLGLKKADVVIEAIIEDLEVKQALYKEIEPKLKPDTLLATNTSSIPLEQLAPVLEDPSRLVGLHFFNPVAKMPLVEIVRGAQSGEAYLSKALALTRHIDKLPLPVKSTPGFLVNRVLMPYLLEAVILEQEGVPKRLVDKVATDFGMPMGPLELADVVGLDVCLYVGNILSKELGFEVPDRLGALVSAGRLGKKSGQGFYEYRKGKLVKPKEADFTGDRSEVQDRLMLRFINEAVAVLRESIVEDADLVDARAIFATGFAPFRGGPLHYMDAKGRQALKQRLQDLKGHYGNRFEADNGWAV